MAHNFQFFPFVFETSLLFETYSLSTQNAPDHHQTRSLNKDNNGYKTLSTPNENIKCLKLVLGEYTTRL